jgi:RNA polymerase sigma-70 factor (ECF subfamily)
VTSVIEPSDETLAAEARGGDQAAARVLHERYLPMLRGRAARALGPRMRRRVAESDVIQETWLTAFFRLESFVDRGPGSFRTWLARILKNKIHDEVRDHVIAARRSVRREQSQDGGAPEARLVGAGSSPSLHAAKEEERRDLLAAIDSLPSSYRMLLRLIHVEGLSVAEAADGLGRSANGTCKLYGRALERLTEVLERRGDAK